MKKDTPNWAYALVILGIISIVCKLLGWHDFNWLWTTSPLWVIFAAALVVIPFLLLFQVLAKWYYRKDRRKRLSFDHKLYPMFVTHKRSGDIYYMYDPENGMIFSSSSKRMKGHRVKVHPNDVEPYIGLVSVYTFAEVDYQVVLRKPEELHGSESS
jgi:hypothetical protein